MPDVILNYSKQAFVGGMEYLLKVKVYTYSICQGVAAFPFQSFFCSLTFLDLHRVQLFSSILCFRSQGSLRSSIDLRDSNLVHWGRFNPEAIKLHGCPFASIHSKVLLIHFISLITVTNVLMRQLWEKFVMHGIM